MTPTDNARAHYTEPLHSASVPKGFSTPSQESRCVSSRSCHSCIGQTLCVPSSQNSLGTLGRPTTVINNTEIAVSLEFTTSSTSGFVDSQISTDIVSHYLTAGQTLCHNSQTIGFEDNTIKAEFRAAASATHLSVPKHQPTSPTLPAIVISKSSQQAKIDSDTCFVEKKTVTLSLRSQECDRHPPVDDYPKAKHNHLEAQGIYMSVVLYKVQDLYIYIL